MIRKISYILLGLVFIGLAVGITYAWPSIFWNAILITVEAGIPLFLIFFGLIFLMIGWAYEEPVQVSRADLERQMKELEEQPKPAMPARHPVLPVRKVKRGAKRK